MASTRLNTDGDTGRDWQLEKRDMDRFRGHDRHRVTPKRQSLIPIVEALAAASPAMHGEPRNIIVQIVVVVDGGCQKRAAYCRMCMHSSRSAMRAQRKVELWPCLYGVCDTRSDEPLADGWILILRA